mmetsp:Transcript_26822/g.80989  ORF Transcript_26822/g.80989 Transcript_26822/m.80989 type:complete len:139 (-) Transcript_26822:953-1369(-)
MPRSIPNSSCARPAASMAMAKLSKKSCVLAARAVPNHSAVKRRQVGFVPVAPRTSAGALESCVICGFRRLGSSATRGDRRGRVLGAAVDARRDSHPRGSDDARPRSTSSRDTAAATPPAAYRGREDRRGLTGRPAVSV